MSEQQRDDILAQERERREESINRRALTQIEMLELRDLMTAGPRDLGAIEAKLRELSERRVDAEMAALRREEAMRGILSAEQVEALREIAQEARSDRPRDGRRGRARRR